jgi:hypothetical protein
MSAPLVIAIVVGVVMMDLVIIAALLHGLKNTVFGPLSQRYPARPPGEDAVTKRFQSFKMGMYNLGFSFHVTVDESHLHLDPAGFWRKLGAEPSSVPWSDIEVVRRGKSGKWTTVKIGGKPTPLLGPSWCLDLADPETDGGPGRISVEQ